MGKLFGSSGVRGLANVELTPTLGVRLAQPLPGVCKGEVGGCCEGTRVAAG
jgi:phosphomannomutase